jgi:hypothetical protein
MSSAHSKAQAKRWATKKPDERSRRMSALAQQRWANVPTAARKRIAARLIQARNKKNHGKKVDSKRH